LLTRCGARGALFLREQLRVAILLRVPPW